MVGVDALRRLGETRAGRSPAIARQDVDVVRREVDRHADVADARRERTGTPARDRVDRREPATLEEQPAELEHRRVEPFDVADLQRHAAALRGVDERGGVLGRRREWLFDERGHAAFERRQRERQVRRRRRGDDDRVEVGFGEHREGLREPLGAGPGRRRLDGRPIGVGDRHEPGARHRRQDAEMVTAHRTETDEADAEVAVPGGRPG